MSSSRCTSRSVRSTTTVTAQLEYAGAPVPKRMNRVTDPGKKAIGFLRQVPDPGEAPDIGTEAAVETDQDTSQLAGRPKNPD